MEEIIFKMLETLPMVAVVLYIWIICERSHSKEREQWRQLIESRDQRIIQLQETTNRLISEVKKLTFIIEKYVIDERKTANRE